MEALVWPTETLGPERVAVQVAGDYCAAFACQSRKVATSSAETVVTAIIISWHVASKVGEPRDVGIREAVRHGGLLVHNFRCLAWAWKAKTR
ncbi:MAG: hypothetical protein KatS3mg077_1151 [Candidatus Binatia bacterium]|nr:MAG: hypothetical protein KatS3mg077_1151 [Candidatus Binatia bacterium]